MIPVNIPNKMSSVSATFAAAEIDAAAVQAAASPIVEREPVNWSEMRDEPLDSEEEFGDADFADKGAAIAAELASSSSAEPVAEPEAPAASRSAAAPKPTLPREKSISIVFEGRRVEMSLRSVPFYTVTSRTKSGHSKKVYVLVVSSLVIDGAETPRGWLNSNRITLFPARGEGNSSVIKLGKKGAPCNGKCKDTFLCGYANCEQVVQYTAVQNYIKGLLPLLEAPAFDVASWKYVIEQALKAPREERNPSQPTDCSSAPRERNDRRRPGNPAPPANQTSQDRHDRPARSDRPRVDHPNQVDRRGPRDHPASSSRGPHVDLAKENAELRARNTALEAEVEHLRAQVSSLIGMMANMNAAAQKK